MTLEDPPHASPRPPTLQASHLLTGPTGCPGFEFSGLLRTIRRRARHCVTICRELRHSDQITKSEHGETDRRSFLTQSVTLFVALRVRGNRPVQAWGRVRRGRTLRKQATFISAAREMRSDPQRLLDDTPHPPIGKLHGVTICRELRHSDQINKSEHAGTDRHSVFGAPRPHGRAESRRFM